MKIQFWKFTTLSLKTSNGSTRESTQRFTPINPEWWWMVEFEEVPPAFSEVPAFVQLFEFLELHDWYGCPLARSMRPASHHARIPLPGSFSCVGSRGLLPALQAWPTSKRSGMQGTNYHHPSHSAGQDGQGPVLVLRLLNIELRESQWVLQWATEDTILEVELVVVVDHKLDLRCQG